jgi:hypothetical protein
MNGTWNKGEYRMSSAIKQKLTTIARNLEFNYGNISHNGVRSWTGSSSEKDIE